MDEPTDVQVWGITMMRDEEDVAGAVIEHMVGEGLNGIIVADNGSVDRTRQEILDRVDWAERKGCRLIVQEDSERAYYQSAKMSRLADQAAGEGADWIVPFDADEIWVSHRDRLAVVLRATSADVAQATLFNHFCTRVDDPAEANPFLRLRWRMRDQGALPKVAFRYQKGVKIHQGNHGVDLPDGGRTSNTFLEVRHFPYRSPEQFIRKALNGGQAYAATDLPQSEGAHWRQYKALHDGGGDAVLIEVFNTYFNFLSPIDEGLVLDPAPYLRWRLG
jgi:hypothetical protein